MSFLNKPSGLSPARALINTTHPQNHQAWLVMYVPSRRRRTQRPAYNTYALVNPSMRDIFFLCERLVLKELDKELLAISPFISHVFSVPFSMVKRLPVQTSGDGHVTSPPTHPTDFSKYRQRDSLSSAEPRRNQ